MEHAFTFIPRYVDEPYIDDWTEAYSEQISRIEGEIQIATTNYKRSQDQRDQTDLEDLQKWLAATQLAQSLDKEKLHPQEIAQRLREAQIDLNFTGSEEFLEALVADDFEAMLDW
jgi:hypothetical protein